MHTRFKGAQNLPAEYPEEEIAQKSGRRLCSKSFLEEGELPFPEQLLKQTDGSYDVS